MLKEILSTFALFGRDGLTRAELAYLLTRENAQHLVCKPVLDLIKMGAIVETEQRRKHPVKGRTGAVLKLAEFA